MTETTIYIDKYGLVVDKTEYAHIVTLTGSFHYSPMHNVYVYEVKEIYPPLPLQYISSPLNLFE